MIAAKRGTEARARIALHDSREAAGESGDARAVIARPIGASAAARLVRHGAAYSLGMSLRCLTYAHLACLNSVRSVIVRGLHRGSCDMSWHGAGLLLALAMMIGGAVGIGLPLAVVIIWICS
jgi:hypothetical protein